MLAVSNAPVSPGDTLAGKYRVERVLGAGNMGVVVAATNIALERLVALKFMLSGEAQLPEQHERFLREARAAARLKSQHVAQVLDTGTLENGAPYTVMEFLEGQDLSALLEERGPLPVEEAALYILQVCEAMGEAHAAGIVHRDLKPANLFLTQDISGAPCVKVLDFGISKLSGALTLTQEGHQLGSPLYMSPEQLNGAKGIDTRSDIWALGVILYQFVTGQPPFDAQTIEELYGRVFFGQPTPLRVCRSDAPPELEAVILRCLQKDRDRRWPNVAELAAAIAPYAPVEARAYADRVARVLGGRSPKSPSLPDAIPSPKGSDPASLTAKPTFTAVATTEPMVYRVSKGAAETALEIAKTEPSLGSPPATTNPSSAGSEPSPPLGTAAPLQRSAAPVERATPPARRSLILAGALIMLAVPVAVVAWLYRREPGPAPPSDSSASAETLVQPSNRPVPVAPTDSATGSIPASTGAAPRASGPPPSASSSAPTVLPLSGTSRRTDRTTGAGTATTPSKATAQPTSSPAPTTRSSHPGID